MSDERKEFWSVSDCIAIAQEEGIDMRRVTISELRTLAPGLTRAEMANGLRAIAAIPDDEGKTAR